MTVSTPDDFNLSTWKPCTITPDALQLYCLSNDCFAEIDGDNNLARIYDNCDLDHQFDFILA